MTALLRQTMPVWERTMRVIAGAAVIVYGLLRARGVPMELLVIGSGAMLALTGVLRFCPACALAGRGR